MLLKYPNLSTFQACLPTVLITPGHHVVPAHVSHLVPQHVHTQLSRVLWADQIDKLRTAIESIKAFGATAAENFIKHFEDHGKLLLEYASHWEKWQISGGVEQMRFSVSKVAARSKDDPMSKEQDSTIKSSRAGQDVADRNSSTRVGARPPSADARGEGKGACRSIHIHFYIYPTLHFQVRPIRYLKQVWHLGGQSRKYKSKRGRRGRSRQERNPKGRSRSNEGHFFSILQLGLMFLQNCQLSKQPFGKLHLWMMLLGQIYGVD